MNKKKEIIITIVAIPLLCLIIAGACIFKSYTAHSWEEMTQKVTPITQVQNK